MMIRKCNQKYFLSTLVTFHGFAGFNILLFDSEVAIMNELWTSVVQI